MIQLLYKHRLKTTTLTTLPPLLLLAVYLWTQNRPNELTEFEEQNQALPFYYACLGVESCSGLIRHVYLNILPVLGTEAALSRYIDYANYSPDLSLNEIQSLITFSFPEQNFQLDVSNHSAVKTIRASFPKLKFLHLVRDLKLTVVSYLIRNSLHLNRTNFDFYERKWAKLYYDLSNECQNHSRYCFAMKYEDFISNTNGSLTRYLRFFGMPNTLLENLSSSARICVERVNELNREWSKEAVASNSPHKCRLKRIADFYEVSLVKNKAYKNSTNLESLPEEFYFLSEVRRLALQFVLFLFILIGLVSASVNA
jgi:hypothetical protein